MMRALLLDAERHLTVVDAPIPALERPNVTSMWLISLFEGFAAWSAARTLAALVRATCCWSNCHACVNCNVTSVSLLTTAERRRPTRPAYTSWTSRSTP